MRRKTTNVGELARALRAPAFGNPATDTEQASLDPVSPTTLVLRVSEIKAYEHNPRLAANREYPRLKESIRTRRGLTTPLTVTKRPGEKLCTIAAGGNSRLRVLKELAEETGDAAFATVTCRFEPWDSECQVLANHLIENDVRGNMLFGDKARAIVEWQRLYEDSHAEEPPLTQRELAERLAEAGYRVPAGTINRLLYAAKILIPLLPQAFESGLGRPAVEQLIRLRTLSAQYWQDTVNQMQPPALTFDEVFAETCAREDRHCADWDYELFQSALTARMTQVLGVDHKLVALDVDSLYHGYPVEVSAVADSATDKAPQGLTSEWAFERSRQINTIKRERARARLDAQGSHHPPAKPPNQSDRDDGQLPGDRPADASRPTHAHVAVTTDDLRRLREDNYLAARQLAENHELDEFLKPVETGFGFFVEAPDPSAVRSEPANQPTDPTQGLVLTGIRSALWWLLCLAADELASSHLAELGRFYPASWIVELFTHLPERTPETDPLSALSILVGEPTAQALVGDVLTDPSFTDEDWGALNQLLQGCRNLRAAAAKNEIDLWGRAR